MIRNRAALLATTCFLPVLLAQSAVAQQAPAAARPAVVTRRAPPAGGTIRDIQIEGNKRIESGTVLSYMALQPGDPFDPERMDRSLKTLYATGLFSDVKLDRVGDTLVVHVVENPIVNRVAFEGNHKLTDDDLRKVVQLKPRSVFTPLQVQADRQALLNQYAAEGRFAATVVPKIIRLPDNRVDVVFEINEGQAALVSRIAFVGNHAFSESTLREVVDTREHTWWRILSSSDTYNPERVNYDKELLRRFYLKNGYADFKVVDAQPELSRDRKSFFLTYVLDEGARYRVNKVSVNNKLPHFTDKQLLSQVELSKGDWYDGDAVERSDDAISTYVQNHDQPFVEVHPRISRNTKKHTVDLVFDVTTGPRVYVERIDIVGNTRTEDKVIRRQFQFAEGDPLNPNSVRLTKQRLEDLQFFNSVNINTAPGSAPDRAIVTANISEKATGELSLGGGYSTQAGALLNVGLREHNFIGTGIDAGVNGVIAQAEEQIDFSVTDPYFLDRNLLAGFDVFHTSLDNRFTGIASYSERRTGGTFTLGYAFNDHIRQSLNYTVVDRGVFHIGSTASIYIRDFQGASILSQIGQTFTIDYRDSTVDPHTGWVLRLGTDAAGLGGDARFVRGKVDARYYIPLDYFTGNSSWGIALSAGAGYLFNEGRPENIVDRFFLGGDNLRGFLDGGAGPHDVITGDSIGGRFIYTQSTELRFPLPISKDFGLSGRAFVDIGGLTGSSTPRFNSSGIFEGVTNSSTPRIGIGVGVAWHSPFGLINIDIADPIVKQKFDQTEVFRFGFGTRF